MSFARSFSACGLLTLALAACDARAQEPARLPARGAPPPRVSLGIEVLLADGAPALAGKRLGLVTNPSGVDSKLVATADLLARDKRWTLVQLFSPEHGVRGDALAGASVASSVDAATGLPVESLYGDAKQPSAAALGRIDAILFDIQDVGSRTYTYISTLGEVMAAAGKAHKPVWVLDRPNPLGGLLFEGPLREERWKSFIGYGPMPVSHGMTIGEVARFFQKELAIDVELHVVAMRGWRRSMVWEDTGLEWVPTSPHIPHALSAHAYIATGMIGGVAKNVNEGVGWTLPFETIAAEFIDARAFREALESARLPGVRFRETHYTPRYGEFADKPLHGVQLHLVDLHEFRPLRTALTALCTLQRLYGPKLELESERDLGIHWGTLSVFEAIRAGASPATIEAAWAGELESFARKRAAVLLYE
ncbi:MAG: DUF1343 domain-containing protein [Planctomycetota bacterium]